MFGRVAEPLHAASPSRPAFESQVFDLDTFGVHAVARDDSPKQRDGLPPPDWLERLDADIDQLRPDAVLIRGDDATIAATAARVRARGAAVLAQVDGVGHRDARAFAEVDAIFTGTRHVADYYREALGLHVDVLPPWVDPARVRAELLGRGFVTFVDPTAAHGVFAFARIAKMLGESRPDIPLLVVEGEGTETTLAACGLDLRLRGNLNVMPAQDDPRTFWSVTRVLVLPTLAAESLPSLALDAFANGIPIVATNRGTLPEILGAAGVPLALPDRLTPATRLLPTAEEVAPWVEAIIKLWDDPAHYAEHRQRAFDEAKRWAPEVVEPQYARYFAELRRGDGPPKAEPTKRTRAAVLVPYYNQIEPECEAGLRALEQSGVRVVRFAGSSQIDVARNVLASDALHDGYESLMFIDSDIGFDPLDALRLLARPEPVLAGIYAKKGHKDEMTCTLLDGVDELLFGPNAPGLYPLKYAPTGFLRIRAEVLRRMIDELHLPLCNTQWGHGFWPFFQPVVVPHEDGNPHYLGDDWSFSHRLSRLQITPLADTTIRLWHFGRYAYGWEDATSPPPRSGSFLYRVAKRG